MSKIVVAVDGPAGSGKSSVSKQVARQLGFDYLDTGAGYRAFAIYHENNQQLGLDKMIAEYDYFISVDPDNPLVMVEGIDVTEEIRSERVSKLVSAIARQEMVRKLQFDDARMRIAASTKPGIVVEGRDITTVVAPDATLKVLLKASQSVRLERRGLEGAEPSVNILARDLSDSQVVDFITPAKGVSLLDTTEMNFQQSVAALITMIEEVS